MGRVSSGRPLGSDWVMEASRNPKYIQDRKRSCEEKKLGSTPEKTLLALIRNMDPLLTNEENGNRWL